MRWFFLGGAVRGYLIFFRRWYYINVIRIWRSAQWRSNSYLTLWRVACKYTRVQHVNVILPTPSYSFLCVNRIENSVVHSEIWIWLCYSADIISTKPVSDTSNCLPAFETDAISCVPRFPPICNVIGGCCQRYDLSDEDISFVSSDGPPHLNNFGSLPC